MDPEPVQSTGTVPRRNAFLTWKFRHHFTLKEERSGRNLTLQCKLCLPATKLLSASKDSTSNLKKHLEDLLLLVHINPKLIRKIRLTKAPESLDELYNELRQKLELVGVHTDPAILHLFPRHSQHWITRLIPQLVFCSVIRAHRRSISQWPTPFPIPMFSYDVELILRKGNETFEKMGMTLPICKEFTRVTTKDLLGTFRAALHMFTPRLLKLYRARKGAFSRDMEKLLEELDEQTSDIALHRRQAALEGLPIFLRENADKFYRTCLATDPEDRWTKGVQMGVLTVLEDDTQHTVIDNVLVLEEIVVLRDVPDFPTALAYVFGLLYALNMEFPKELKYTFETIQHIFMEMSTDCSQRVRSFKMKLLSQ
ncbi:hypothetical protein ACEWY4_020433 [Coilia grayii]|uniref:Uncharacterized protein n=1 Tax=Coilia grayii TaxID=363190 RepID=A0ABD1JEW1_9TELE